MKRSLFPILVRSLSKRFGGVRALTDISLEAEGGEAIVMAGPNGAGKTTLLRVLSGLLSPSGGSVRYGSVPASGFPPGLREQLGYLSHETMLYEDLTAEENLFYLARMYGKGEERDRIRRMVDRTGLRGWHDRPLRELSCGMRKRAAIARVWLFEPGVLLLDEPFSGLDEKGLDLVRGLIRESQARGTTVFLVTHDLSRGLPLCSRALTLSRGRLTGDWKRGTEGWESLAALYREREGGAS